MEKKKLTMIYGESGRRFTPDLKKCSQWVVGAMAALFFSSLPVSVPAEVSPAEVAAKPEVRELRYEVRVADAPAGWMVVREIVDGDRRITETEMHMELRRGETSQSMGMDSRFVESADHRPLSAEAVQRLGQQPMRTEYVINGDQVTVAGTGGERQMPLPEGPWLTPFAAKETLVQEMSRVVASATEDTFDITMLDPTLGLRAVKTRWTLLQAEARVTIDDEPRIASRWQQNMDYAPGMRVTADVAANGDVLRTVTPFAGLDMVVTLTSKSLPQIQQAEGSKAVPAPAPEVMRPGFVHPDRKIDDPRNLQSASYRLYFDGDMPALPRTDSQRWEKIEGGARVWVSLRRQDLARPEEVEAERSIDQQLHLRATDFLQHQNPVIRDLASSLKFDTEADLEQKAEALRRLVFRHLRAKNLDSVMASAVEAAENGSGDCTEHGMLLAALLRAEGIPSRVVVGLIYADQFLGEQDFFGYHMWAQAWIDGRWLDLDATLPDAVPYDAAHIALATSALADTGASLVDLAAVTPLLGRLRIEVEDLSWAADDR